MVFDPDRPGFALLPIGRVRSSLHEGEEAPKQPDEGAPPAWLEFEPAVGEGLTDLKVGDEVLRCRPGGIQRDADLRSEAGAGRGEGTVKVGAQVHLTPSTAMDPITYRWSDATGDRAVRFVHVQGTGGQPYPFGESSAHPVEVHDFFIGTVPVTQAFLMHALGADANRSANRGPDLPLENVSWDDLTQPGGLLQRINESAVAAAILAPLGRSYSFRLPSETEWEYAARGGPYWRDGFRFSGSNDVEEVAWYDRRHGDHTRPVGLKLPNQLGIHDMSGNVWEWCQDVHTTDLDAIPQDGTPFNGAGDDRVLRGGCFHNWAIHCTVTKRYEIGHEFHDGCIGFRLVLS